MLGLRLRGGAGTPGLAMGEMVGRALKRGQEAADAGALEAAIEAFTSGLDLDPTCGRWGLGVRGVRDQGSEMRGQGLWVTG